MDYIHFQLHCFYSIVLKNHDIDAEQINAVMSTRQSVLLAREISYWE